MNRRGFALLAVLWFLSGITALAAATAFRARGLTATADNRAALLRAEWRAEECLARARAVIAAELGGTAERDRATDHGPGAAGFRSAVISSVSVSACPGSVDLEPIGLALDVNRATPEMLARAFIASGIAAAVADSLSDALVDWRDEDDSVRASGAEADWYLRRSLSPPRNAPIAAIDELRLIRGFAEWMGADNVSGIASLFTIDSTRILLEGAPSAVLAALPGMTPSAVAALDDRRRSDAPPLPDLLAMIDAVPEDARGSLSNAYSDLVSWVTIAPEGWLLRARASGVVDDPAAERLQVEIVLHLVFDGKRTAIVDRRITP